MFLVDMKAVDVVEVSVPGLGHHRQAAVEDARELACVPTRSLHRAPVPTLLVLVMLIG